jgi:hypothetical protein
LAADALQLWECHGCSRELDGRLHKRDLDRTSAFSWVVFLVDHDLGEYVRGGLVEFIEVVLLCCRFLGVSARRARVRAAEIHTSTVARFALTTLVLPSLPTRASHMESHGGVSSSSTTMNSGLSQRVMPLGSS